MRSKAKSRFDQSRVTFSASYHLDPLDLDSPTPRPEYPLNARPGRRRPIDCLPRARQRRDAFSQRASMSVLPPPSQPSTSRLSSSRPTSSASDRKPSSSAPRTRKRGPVQPGGDGFKDDRRPPTQEIAPESSRKGKEVDRRATAPLTSHLASIKPHAPPSPPPKKRPHSPTVAASSLRPAKRAQPPPAPTKPKAPPKFAIADCLDAFRPSRLLVSEYEKYGNPTYTQGKGSDRRFFKSASLVAPPPGPMPSWIGGDVGKLGTALTTSARLVPEIWGRDLVGTGQNGRRMGGVRAVNIQGIDMYLVGKEFPARSVALVGILVGVEDKTEKIVYHCALFHLSNSMECKANRWLQ